MEDPTDPIARLNFADRPRKEVQIVSTDLVEKMLLHALQNSLELLPFLVLGFFTGIRPSGELEKLLWSDIDLVGRVITIRPEVSKTNRRRFPELSENAVAWLEVYRQRGRFIKGAIRRVEASAYPNSKPRTCERAQHSEFHLPFGHRRQ
jgi:integrase